MKYQVSGASVWRAGVVLGAALGMVVLAGLWHLPAQADNNKASSDIVLLSATDVVPGPGDVGTGGSGVELTIWNYGRMCWFADANGLTGITSVDLHHGVRGESGALVLQLHGPASQSSLAGCHDVGKSLVDALQANPGGYYIDVDTETHPSGALRGQLDNGVGTDGAVELTDEQVVPTGAGDPDPYAHAFVEYGVARDGRFCVSSQADVRYPVVVDLHRGALGQQGDVVAHLYGPTDVRNYHACTDLGPELARDLTKNPGDFYIDVHNQEYPGGALRGQLRS